MSLFIPNKKNQSISYKDLNVSVDLNIPNKNQAFSVIKTSNMIEKLTKRYIWVSCKFQVSNKFLGEQCTFVLCLLMHATNKIKIINASLTPNNAKTPQIQISQFYT